MITESQIKAAMRSGSVTGKTVELKDGGERSAGRLALHVRALKGKVVAEWYAVQSDRGQDSWPHRTAPARRNAGEQPG
ncbi:MAG: hypothetical protein Q7V31_05805 [Parvibaculum sp.]|uniref:hypothetical protein n=1 Tax=Parvibaculum sp. TaxID=2024848 RepID=UPI0027188A17|nr:hypothetical protein [Parvibaculum sp.]MDO8838424.1 hypothetical protein [Parvibaculum sp.]